MFACGMVNLLMIIMCLKIALVSYIDYNPFQLKNDTVGCRGKLFPIWKDDKISRNQHNNN